LLWQLVQLVVSITEWLKMAPAHDCVLWQPEHWPVKWFAGADSLWHDWQSLLPLPIWLKFISCQEIAVWQDEQSASL
jgi:hypothetical protein